MSNDSSDKRDLILGRSHTDSEIRAMDPLLGIGTGLPIGMKLASSTLASSDQGAIIDTWCPDFLNCSDKLLMWVLTPPSEA